MAVTLRATAVHRIRLIGRLHFFLAHPRSAFGAFPLAGGDASGLAEPVPRHLWKGARRALCESDPPFQSLKLLEFPQIPPLPRCQSGHGHTAQSNGGHAAGNRSAQNPAYRQTSHFLGTPPKRLWRFPPCRGRCQWPGGASSTASLEGGTSCTLRERSPFQSLKLLEFPQIPPLSRCQPGHAHTA